LEHKRAVLFALLSLLLLLLLLRRQSFLLFSPLFLLFLAAFARDGSHRLHGCLHSLVVYLSLLCLQRLVEILGRFRMTALVVLVRGAAEHIGRPAVRLL